MKLNSSELLASEPLLSTGGQHMSPPARSSKSSAFGGAVTAVDMAGDMYSPILKGSGKSEYAVSRIHCIPLLMLFVFFVLWAASSEVLPDVRIATTSTQLGTSELELKMATENEDNSQPGGRTVLQQHDSSQHASAASLTNTLPEKAQLRGNARSITAR